MRARRFPLPGGYRMLVGHDVQERQDVKNLMMRGLIAAVVMTLLLGLGGGFWMGRRILAQAVCNSAARPPKLRRGPPPRAAVLHGGAQINTIGPEKNTQPDQNQRRARGAAHRARQRP